MAEFRYQGRRAGLGQRVTGVCRAANANAAVQWLQGEGILVVAMERQQPVTWPWSQGLALDELLFFTRQMVALCQAGVPLVRGLQSLTTAAQPALLQRVLTDVLLDLQSGHSLATALAAHPRAFDALYVRLVAMGEETGRLAEAFQRLNDHLAHRRLMKQRLAEALRYPILVLAALLLAVLVIGIWVIPTFATLFQSFGVPLPMVTRLLLAFSHGLLTVGPWLLALSPLAVWGVARLLASRRGRQGWHGVLLRLPLVGSLLRQILLARLCHGLAMGFKSGLTLVKTLAVVGESVDHPLVSQGLARMGLEVQRGGGFFQAARLSGLFTPVALQMILVGEESGQLDSLLQQTADYYDQESRQAIARLQSYLEPLLTLFVALLVLLLALGVFLPLWDLGHAALRH